MDNLHFTQAMLASFEKAGITIELTRLFITFNVGFAREKKRKKNTEEKVPRVRRHRVSKSQGSSERVLPWQVTMGQIMRLSLHTHFWYEVGMLKVPV